MASCQTLVILELQGACGKAGALYIRPDNSAGDDTHALRAYSPREQKAVRTAADTFRANPAFDCATVITNLGTGEALVSTLEAKGAPSIVERTLIRPPSGRVGPVTDAERQQIMSAK